MSGLSLRLTGKGFTVSTLTQSCVTDSHWTTSGPPVEESRDEPPTTTPSDVEAKTKRILVETGGSYFDFVGVGADWGIEK